MQKIMMFSITGFLENIRYVFRIYALRSPNMIPINHELKANPKKSLQIPKTSSPEISSFLVEVVNLSTALNKIIETASFVIPSPNTILKSLGYAS